MANQHRRVRQEVIGELVTKQRKLAASLLDGYYSASYGNDQVDRITEQQLLAAEHSLAALQLIAVQNTQIIELLADVSP